MQSFAQGTFATADYLNEGATASGTVTDNNQGPVNIPFHYYKTSLAGNGIIRIISQITNTHITSAGYMYIKVFFKDEVLWATKQVNLNALQTVTDTFTVTGVEKDSIYILYENYGVVAGGPYNYTMHYDLTDVLPNNEIDPNNYHVDAQTLHPGDMVNGHISFKSDAYYLDEFDYYRLIMPENGTADLYFSWTNLSVLPTWNIPGPTVYARGKDSIQQVSLAHSSSTYSSQQVIANNNNTSLLTTVYDTMHIYGRAKDTLYIHLYNYFSGWGIAFAGAYTLRYEMSDLATTNEINPNDDFAHAQTISLADTVHGIIGYRDGVNAMDENDYFKMATPPGDSVKIYITAVNKFKYEPMNVNPAVWAYDKNGTALTVYSASGASSAGGQLIANIWQPAPDIPVHDIMTITGITTDSVYLRVSDYAASFIYHFSKTTLTGIEDVNAEHSLNVYPNPASHQISLVLNKAINSTAEVSLYSLDGKRITTLYDGRIDSNVLPSLQLPAVENGIYFISVKTENGNEFREKIVVMN